MRLFWAIAPFALGALVSAASAHSPLKATAPADGAVLTAAPESLEITFKRDMRLTRVEVTHAEGDPVALDLSEMTGFAADFVIPSPGFGAGAYLIEWRGLSDDGHPQTGSFRFTVD